VKPLSFRVLLALTLLALTLPLLATCSGVLSRADASSAVSRDPATMPTAAVRYTAAPTARIAPTGMPALPAAGDPTSTVIPYPTPLPQPPTPTTMPQGPGGLPFPLKTERLEFGVAAHLFYTDRDTPLAMARDGGFGWVRQQVHWKDQEGPAGNYVWGELDPIVDTVNAYGLKLMISVVRAPSFYTANGGDGLPQDPQALGNFVAALAEHYRGKVQAIEIWNEQNLAHENGGEVSTDDAAHYVEILKASYLAIKAVDPSIMVIAGPPASTATNVPNTAISDERYYRAMYSYQNGVIRNYFDAQAVHPGGSANPPDTFWPDAPSAAQGWTTDRTFYFRHVEDARRLMEEYGLGDHQIWITEFGWATQNSSPGFEFGNQISYDQQADYIVGAMRRAKEQYPWVGNMFLWNLNFGPLKAQQGEPLHEQASFGILNGDFSPRPSYLAIQQYIGQLRAQGQ
jgi:polysaccharide biosynthesis protein PslG